MPEYLAPGVYVEEVDTGAKPIEGVSTSTAGMVGVAERGPVDVPVLVTSVGEYTRWFGGLLSEPDYGVHRFLPHAVEGFFTNGGKRVFVTRVVDTAATRAASPLFDRGGPASIASALVRAAGEGTGAAASPPSLVILPVSGLGMGDWVRVGDGSTAEYRQASGAPTPEDVVVPVDLPLSRSHAAGVPAEEVARAPLPGTFTLAGGAEVGDSRIVVQGAHADIALVVPGDCLEIGGGSAREYRFVREATGVTVVSATDSTVRLLLDSPLALPHPDATLAPPVVRIDLATAAATATVQSAAAGSGLLFVDARGGAFDAVANLVRLDTGLAREVRRIGRLSELDLIPGAYDDYAAGTLVEAVAFAANRTVAAATATTIQLQPGEAQSLAVGQRLVVDPTGSNLTVTVQSISADTITVTPAMASVPAAGDEVIPLPKRLTAPVNAGGQVLALDDRMGIAEGSLLRVGTGAASEVVTVTSLPALSFVAPDPGNVVVSPPLANAFPAVSTEVHLVGAPAPAVARPPSTLALPAAAGASQAYVTDGTGYALNDVVRMTTAGGDVSYHRLTQNASPVAPEILTLQTALARSHPIGSAVVGRDPLFDVEALDAGIWGNRLRISVEDESPGLVASTTLATIVDANTVRLASAAGVQPGTVLEIFDPATGAVVDGPVKVSNVNRAASFTLTLAGSGLTAAQQSAGLGVRSREFRLTVRLLRQPDRNNPSRNEQEIDSEVFRYLSMDPRHSNYIESVIGDIDGTLRKWDRRPEGSSLYIRVRDLATNQAEQESVRLGPEPLVDVLPDGRRRPARLRLEQVVGGDSIGSLTDAQYVGADNVDPELRTGLQSMRNVEEISIVAVPGIVSAQVQQSVIDHCELLRYRFAVLDSLPEPTDTVADVQNQRQQFDTKYAALYYPWLTIPSPYPANRPGVQDYPIPPSGHVLGVYARTDIARGVHKAPANEVVRGIVGLRRRVNKEQQDILNPYPVNINVIRDFRDNNRGIRVYGGRVITSDSDWKYVNVRRLLIFIEASLDRGLQWVVFEPNAEPLWARVRRVVSNFLTVLWQNGALEGAAVEEAFFVKCDRTTMTQTEIDNGQLIVLVGVAPVKPAEFVIIRIGLWTARSES
jgi:phage tail sheath protein FI